MNDSASAAQTTIVGIGASAGGLDALKQFLACTPSDSGLAYVVVVHLTPEQPSLLADLLQPHAGMPVQQVHGHTVVESDNVYVIPPGFNLATIDSHLRLSALESERRKRTPVDHFFDTLSQTHGEHCVGVVLSGTGSDGTVGISMIKERGGLTIAQEPNEAEFDSMPRSAMATGLVDLVLPVREMPAVILRFLRTRPRIAPEKEQEDLSQDDRQALDLIFGQVRARAAQDFSRYKQSTVLRRIRRRMQLHETEQLGDYLGLLREDPREVHLLANELLVTVTQFFRDPEIFKNVQDRVVPRLFQGKSADDPVRVWSVGCATGEEAYGIAMLLLEHAATLEEPPPIEVFASDLHEGALARAREGVFADSIESYVSPERLRQFFSKEDSVYHARQELRDVIVFAAHNLLKDPPFSHLDFVVCRNLLIYLQRETQDRVIECFHYALNPDGLLWLGPSETLDRTALFQTENQQDSLYVRRNVPAREPRLPVFPHLRQARRQSIVRDAPRESAPSYGAMHHKMVERVALPSILVDQDHHIVHSSEHAGRYLRVPGGELSVNLFKLVREELRIELRAALHATEERGEPVRTEPIAISLEGVPRHVVLHLRPSQDPQLSGLILVIFDEMQLSDGPTSGAHAVSAKERSELDRTKARLHTVIEQYETSQEEMKSANEELQSANEELRSTMEELETSKEELQSMNEELQTVNQENRHKVEELSQLTSDLNNLMAATDIATLFLDRAFRILRVTPRASKLFNIRARDRGRPLTDLRGLLAYAQLEDDAHAVFETLSPVQREVEAEDGTWYLARVSPYRSATDHIEGVVITLVEITQLKTAEIALRTSEERFRALVSASAQIVWTTNADGRVVEPSASWREFTGQTVEESMGTGWIDVIHPEDREHFSAQWGQCLEQSIPLRIELRLRHFEGGWRWTDMRAVPLRKGLSPARGWVGMNTDITDRKMSEENLYAEDQRKDQFLAVLGHELRNPLAPIRTAMDLFEELLPADERLRQLCAMTDRQVRHLTRLVDDLLDISRVKSGRIELQRRPVDVHDSVRSAIADLRAALDSAGHRLHLHLSGEPLIVDGDDVRLVQMISNLLRNAIKYTPNGGDIRLESRPERHQAVISVADTGIGIAPEILPHVFDMFSQPPQSSHYPAGGLGIGLTLVRRLAELHSGSIEARSDGPGRGSEFVLRLPLAREGLEEATDHGSTGPSSDHSVPKRILVVDDVPDIVASLSAALEIAGHEVRQACDGAAALQIAAEFSPQVVILDIGLPDMDGCELASQLRQRPETKDALLIAVTGYGQAADRACATNAGIDHQLVKPAKLKELMALIDQGV